MVRGLLADLDDAPEESVLVGRVGAVAFDDGVDPAVLGEVHCCCRRDRGPGRYGCWFRSIPGLDGYICVAVFITACE